MLSLNRSLWKIWMTGAISVLGCQYTALAQTAQPLAPADTAVVVEVISDVPTIPEALIRERLAGLQQTIPLPYHKTIHQFIDYFHLPQGQLH